MFVMLSQKLFTKIKRKMIYPLSFTVLDKDFVISPVSFPGAFFVASDFKMTYSPIN